MIGTRFLISGMTGITDFSLSRHSRLSPAFGCFLATATSGTLSVRQKRQLILLKKCTHCDYTTLIRLPANLPPDAKKFIGTIIISELLHAAFNRDPELREHITYHIFVDEFHNFATDDFATMITEGRKFGIATTIAHQERAGQLGKNEKVLNATMACANKVIFQVTVKDAQELAPEFSSLPPQETKQEPAFAISAYPFWDLVERGHGNPFIQECVDKWFIPIARSIDCYKTEMRYIERPNGKHIRMKQRFIVTFPLLRAWKSGRKHLTDGRIWHDAILCLGNAQAASANMMAAHEKAENETARLKTQNRVARNMPARSASYRRVSL